MSLTVSTAGGHKVGRGLGSAWGAAQVRSLVTRGYPAFVRQDALTYELTRSDGQWAAHANATVPLPPWVNDLVAVLNETERR